MNKKVSGYFTSINGKEVYKIENYDCMENFFMTITSSSDVWNFCWSQGGITAGRIDSNHAIFPYYTSDKVHDAGSYTGAYTCIKVITSNGEKYWEPFSSFYYPPMKRKEEENKLIHNIYKNFTGTQVWFEEINTELQILFRTGWTSSEKFGLVRTTYVENLSNKKIKISIFDGCQNIMPACCTSDFQNEKSNLLEAYKKTDLEESSNIVYFSLSSVVSDKAEPNESLYANICWFSTEDKIILTSDGNIIEENVIKGKRPGCFIKREEELEPGKNDNWYQIFDTSLTPTKIEVLKENIKDRKKAVVLLEKDIQDSDDLMMKFLQEADGVQKTEDKMACLHHQQNVMFNIMRGGIFANNGKIDFKDFIVFVNQRNKKLAAEYEVSSFEELFKTNDNQFERLYLEYMPLTFSRRHGDPSRPWNRFNINLKDEKGNQILNYEGNWRDIFQNWEALVYSYPEYVKNMCAKFLNAMTIDGFNPYKINREGIDWEIPDPSNPWAQIGYWGDHQIIYFEKLLEFYSKIKRNELLDSLNKKIYTTSNVPYRIKSYKEILNNPRDTIIFDRELSNILKNNEKTYGSDAKLILDKKENPVLVSFTTKVLQIIIAKIANFVPSGGIWLNTQRPEWNDANNALAGYGLSVVTLCYLYRFIITLIDIYKNSSLKIFNVSKTVYECFSKICENWRKIPAEKVLSDDKERKQFVDYSEYCFEKERESLYKNGFEKDVTISNENIISSLKIIQNHIEQTLKANEKQNGLYHSYNTLKISKNEMKVLYLQEMLEGQVAILSSGYLSCEQAVKVYESLRYSEMYESRQNSYTLYPDKNLPAFYEKNIIEADRVKNMEKFLYRTSNLYLEKDKNGKYHFNSEFRNEECLNNFISIQNDMNQPTAEEYKMLLDLYEETFNHQSFTGRSGTFYAYEGLGSIYWHMVSKLLLAIQENLINAYQMKDENSQKKLKNAYYEVRNGLGYNKTPEIYGAFPADPYSHTPQNQGAKQPGMTGQVKEEILTRWGELGIFVENGIAKFDPFFLQQKEIRKDGTLEFSWCNVPVIYSFGKSDSNEIAVNGNFRKGNELTEMETKSLFSRNGKISKIEVLFPNYKG